MATVDISSADFETTVTDHDIVLVDFWADWCGPCKRFAPVYEKSSERHPDVVYAKLDTDANPDISGALGITGIPTLMAFREGIMVFNQAGALPGPALEEVVTKVKALDMAEIHEQVRQLEAEHAAKHAHS